MSDWEIAAAISELSDVDAALQGFSEDPTGDNGICIVRAVLVAAKEQEEIRLAAISTAALGYWTEKDSIKPEYDHPALRDVAKLYAKYAAQLAAPVAMQIQEIIRVDTAIIDRQNKRIKELEAQIRRMSTCDADTAQIAAPAYRPVGTVRHFIYEGIAKNGHTIEPSLFDGVDLPDGTTLYAAPQGEGK